MSLMGSKAAGTIALTVRQVHLNKRIYFNGVIRRAMSRTFSLNVLTHRVSWLPHCGQM